MGYSPWGRKRDGNDLVSKTATTNNINTHTDIYTHILNKLTHAHKSSPISVPLVMALLAMVHPTQPPSLKLPNALVLNSPLSVG